MRLVGFQCEATEGPGIGSPRRAVLFEAHPANTVTAVIKTASFCIDILVINEEAGSATVSVHPASIAKPVSLVRMAPTISARSARYMKNLGRNRSGTALVANRNVNAFNRVAASRGQDVKGRNGMKHAVARTTPGARCIGVGQRLNTDGANRSGIKERCYPLSTAGYPRPSRNNTTGRSSPLLHARPRTPCSAARRAFVARSALPVEELR